MKGKKFKTEYLILAIIIVVLSLYLILRNPDRMQYDLPELAAIKAEDINKLEIQKPGETITLINKEGKWVVDPQGYPVDDNRLKEMTDSLKDLEISALVSEAKNYVPYGLDDPNRIRVRALNGETVLREVEIGNVASTYRHTFVKLPNDNRVYHARNAIRNYFNKKVEDLHDKKVLGFDQNEISEIRFIKGNREWLFAKNVKPAEVKVDKSEKKDDTETPTKEETPSDTTDVVTWVSKEGKAGANDTIIKVIQDLSGLSCTKYEYDKKKEAFTDPVYTIILKGAKDYTLSIFEKIDKDGEKYPAVSSENPYAFHLSTYKAEDLMKKPADLFPKEEKKDNGDKKK